MPNSEASAQLRALSLAMKQMAYGGLAKKAMVAGIRAGAAPLIPAVQAAARERLPKSGALNEQVAGEKVTISVRMGAKTAGVRLTTKRADTRATNAGLVRHPVFGRDVWVTQEIPDAAGWWSDTLAAKSPEVTPDILAALELAADAIQATVLAGKADIDLSSIGRTSVVTI